MSRLDKFLDSVDRRLTRGYRVVSRKVPWDEIAMFIVIAFAAPILIPWGIFCWIVGCFSEYRENRRNGVRSVK
jgi:hypothetical protein